MRAPRHLIPFVLLVLVWACADEGSQEFPPNHDSPSELLRIDTLASGAQHRHYLEQPEVPRWTLREEVRLGAGEAETEIFGSVQGLELTPDGRILVLDHQAAEVRSFSWEGEYLETVFTRGGGPREIDSGNGLMYGPEGVLWINDPGNGRILGLGPEGRTMTFPRPVGGSSYLWWGGVTHDQWIWDLTVRLPGGMRLSSGLQESQAHLYLKGTNGDQLTAARDEDSVKLGTYTNRVIVAPEGSAVRPVPGPLPISALDPAGFAWAGVQDEYRLTKLSLDGDTVLVLELDVEPTPLSSQERDSIIEGIRSAFSRGPSVDVDWSEIPPDHHPLIENLTVDDRSRLWVLRWSPDETAVWDVFSPDGELLTRVESGFRVFKDHPPVVRGDRFLAVATDDLDVQYVVGGRLIPE